MYFRTTKKIKLFNMKKSILFLCLQWIVLSGFAGPDSLLKKLLRYDSIICIEHSDTLDFPWSGAFNTPQFSSMDINGDLVKDLVIFDRNGEEVRVFLHTGDSGVIGYKHAPEYESAFPRINSWMLLHDYNHDGRPDIFTSRQSGGDMRVFRNESTGNRPEDIKFEPYLFKDPWDSTKKSDWFTYKYFVGGGMIYSNIYCLDSDIPGLADVDRDGDMDILSFGNNTGSIVWYKNVSYDNYGGFDSLDFRINQQCWGGFREDAGSFKLYLNQCLGQAPLANNTQPNRGGAARHEGSSILVYDFTCNNRSDILLGDISFNYMVLGTNHGTISMDEITAQDTLFPSYDVPVRVQTFPAAYIADINNDQINDLLVAPNIYDIFANFDQIHLYKGHKEGTSCPKLKFRQSDFLQEQTLEFGTRARPLFMDVDGDTLTDILVANYGYLSGGFSHSASVAYLKNVGIKTHPVYKLVTRDLFALHIPNDTGLYLAAGDLDGDQITDLLIGAASGRVYFYKNTAAAPGDSAVFVYQPMVFDTTHFGRDIMPTLYDFNKDGLPDLIAGWQGPDLIYVPNTGSATAPEFLLSNMVTSFGNVFHSNSIGEGYLSLLFVEQDTQGMVTGLDTLPHQTYLYIGTEDGHLLVYDNIINTAHPSFNRFDDLFVYGRSIAISGADITADGKMDMVYGQRTGGISILFKDKGNIIKQLPPKPVDTVKISTEELKASPPWRLFPNPSSKEIEVLWLHAHDGVAVVYKIFDIHGQLVGGFQTEQRHFKLDISELPAGIYLIQANTQMQSQTQRFVKQ